MHKSTDKDVRISYHANTTNKHMLMVRFYDNIDELLGRYVKLIPEGNRLYMEGYPTKVPSALKVNSQGVVSAVRGASDLKMYEGEYKELHYDAFSDRYYVDTKEAKSITRIYGSYNNSKPNYKKHSRLAEDTSVGAGRSTPVPNPLTSPSNVVPLKDIRMEDIQPKTKPVREIPQLTPTATLIKALVGFQIYVEGMESAAKLVKELEEMVK